MTGPQTLPAPVAGDGEPDTGTYIAASIERDETRAKDLISAHQHRAPRFAWFRGIFQGNGGTPAPPDAGEPDADEPGEFTQAVNAHPDQGPWTSGVLERPVPEVAPEDADPEPTAAWQPEEVPHDIITDPSWVRHVTAPVASAVPAPVDWDTQASQPVRYVPGLAADLRDNPAFRETLSRRTRDGARECLCGCRIGGQAWGERMVSAGLHLFSLPASTVFTWPPVTGEYRALEAEETIRAYDAEHPVLTGGAA